MNKNKTEFWNSSSFWEPAVITCLITAMIAFFLATIIWNVAVWSNREINYSAKQFLYKAASGEIIDEKTAYFSNNIMDVRAGEFLRDEIKKGVKFENIIKKVEEIVSEFTKFSGDGKQRKIEDYKDYLRKRYNTPEAILYMADADRWKEFSGDEDNVKKLKQALAGSMPKLKEPDYYEGMRRYALFWVLLVQFLVYGIAFFVFKKDEYCFDKYLQKVHIGIGGFMTFLVFIPGALPIIVVQLMMVSWYRLKKSHDRHQIKIKENKSAAKSLDLGSNPGIDSDQQLLKKLRQRVQ